MSSVANGIAFLLSHLILLAPNDPMKNEDFSAFSQRVLGILQGTKREVLSQVSKPRVNMLVYHYTPSATPKGKESRHIRAGNATVGLTNLSLERQTRTQRNLVNAYLHLIHQSLKRFPKSVQQGTYLGAPLRFPSWVPAIQGKITSKEYWRIEFTLDSQHHWKVYRLILISSVPGMVQGEDQEPLKSHHNPTSNIGKRRNPHNG